MRLRAIRSNGCQAPEWRQWAVFLVVLISFFTLTYLARTVKGADNTSWIGRPYVYDNRADFSNFEFGLREDGVVVWRNKQKGWKD